MLFLLSLLRIFDDHRGICEQQNQHEERQYWKQKREGRARVDGRRI